MEWLRNSSSPSFSLFLTMENKSRSSKFVSVVFHCDVVLFRHIIFVLHLKVYLGFAAFRFWLIMRSEFKQSFCTRLSNQRCGFTSLISASTFQPKKCLMAHSHSLSHSSRWPSHSRFWSLEKLISFFVIIKCVPLVQLCCNTVVQMANAN